MGITLRCEKTGTILDATCVGFAKFRIKVACLCSEELGEHHKALFNKGVLKTDAFYKAFNEKNEELIRKKRIPRKLVDFCLQSDEKGVISADTCRIIYNRIKDYDDNLCYGYAGRKDCASFDDIKRLLHECYVNKSKLEWN